MAVHIGRCANGVHGLGVVTAHRSYPPAALLTAMFGDDLVPLLDEVARDAFLRRDGHRRHGQYGVNRSATIRRLDALVANLLSQVGAGPPTLVEWLLRTAVWMAKRWPDRDVGRFDRMLPPGLERQVYDVLRPRLQAAVALRDTSLECALGLTLANGFGSCRTIRLSP